MGRGGSLSLNGGGEGVGYSKLSLLWAVLNTEVLVRNTVVLGGLLCGA